MRRLHSLKWLLRQTPARVLAIAVVVVVLNAALLAVLWMQTFAAGSAGKGASWIAGWATAAASGITLVDFVVFIWLQHNLTATYVDRMQATVAALMDAVITVAPDRSIVLFNPAAERVFGCPASQVLGKPVDVLIPERLRERHRRHMAAFAASGEASRPLGEPGTFSAMRPDGSEFPIDASVLQVGTGAGRLYSIILRDATLRREAEEQAKRLAAIVNASSDAIVGLDTEGRVTHWNAAAELLTGYSWDEMVGRPFTTLAPLAHQSDDAVARALGGEQIMGYQTHWARKDTTQIDMSLSISPIRDEQKRIVGAATVARDVTVQRAAQQARVEDVARLRSLARRLLLAEETQNRLLGRELHDQIGGNLSALALIHQLIRQESTLASPDHLAVRLDSCDAVMRQTIDLVSAVLADLRPTALDELGLLAALRQQARAMGSRSVLHFSVEGTEPSPRLGADSEIALFRIAQEAFTNAAKHSGGTYVRARLSEVNEAITLTIADDGKGVEQIAPGGATRLGMTTMRERAEAINARLQVTGGAAGGTAVTVRLERSAAVAAP